MRRAFIALLALIASVALITTAQAEKPSADDPSATPEVTPSQFSKLLRGSVKTNGVFQHLKALQEIADENDGTRAAGRHGYKESASYVAKTMKGYGWDVSREKFDFDAFFEDAPSTFERVSPNPKVYTEDTEFSTMEFSGSGDVTAELVAVDLTLPPSPEPSSSSGCEASDFTGLNLTGKVALMQRGTCDFSTKVKNATAAGAAATVIFNEGQEGRTDVVFGTLGTPDITVPAVDTSFAIGSELANGALNGPTGTTVHVKTTTHTENLTAQNVVAETPGGSSKNVVMAGAHLDSVADGPGINDNGSGSAALLEIAHRLSDSGVEPNNKIRFAWWGAEEEGLIGSTDYVAGLKKKQLSKIALYLNFDMVGSPNFARLIYDGDGDAFDSEGPKGSDKIEATFEKYFKKADLATGPTQFDGRSDYLGFIDAGIPAGGLFTGAEEVKTDKEAKLYGGKAGVAFDHCYHQACDDLENVSRKAIKQMTPAIADSVARYAIDVSKITKGGGKKGKRLAAPSAAGDAEYLGNELAR
ncbi:MAG: M20/M25/M40 family metallo-hydrolase [Solirubrobacterales bacterium]|nr:M20/M25/M40 family metallo-hydrolase [Solirubrobacterales bacterium]